VEQQTIKPEAGELFSKWNEPKEAVWSKVHIAIQGRREAGKQMGGKHLGQPTPLLSGNL